MTSYWGTDKERNIVLAFGVRRDTTLPERRIGVDLKNPDYQTDVIGLMRDDTPFLRMRGADGKNRVDLLLSLYGKPFLVMSDQAGPRLRLGFEGTDTPASEDNDWSLVFLPEVARIGFRAGKMGGKTMVQGGLFIRKDKLPYP
jgi:hypothetical protein